MKGTSSISSSWSAAQRCSYFQNQATSCYCEASSSWSLLYLFSAFHTFYSSVAMSPSLTHTELTCLLITSLAQLAAWFTDDLSVSHWGQLLDIYRYRNTHTHTSSSTRFCTCTIYAHVLQCYKSVHESIKKDISILHTLLGCCNQISCAIFQNKGMWNVLFSTSSQTRSQISKEKIKEEVKSGQISDCSLNKESQGCCEQGCELLEVHLMLNGGL